MNDWDDDDDYFAVKKQQSEQEKVDPVGKRLKKFTRLSLPLVISFLMMNIQEQINLIFIGNLQDPAKLSGIGVGNMVMNLLPYALMIGINTALETLVS